MEIDPEFLQVTKDLAAATAQLETVREAHQALNDELTQTRQQLTTAQQQAQQQAQELGRLKAIADRHEGLRVERDRLQAQVTQLTANLQQQTSDAVRSALEQADRQHAQAEALWEEERTNLMKQIEELKLPTDDSEPVAIAPTDLATHFANVLESLAEGAQSADAAAKGYSAALTSLDVEAKALLQAPQQGSDQPTLLTPSSGKVNPEQLSVVRMSFRLLPTIARPPEDGPEPE
jgi:chromosome segregation ATPase